MKNTIRAKNTNGSHRASTQVLIHKSKHGNTVPVALQDRAITVGEAMKIFQAGNQLETAVIESNTFTKLMADHFLNQSHHSLQIKVDQEHQNFCFGLSVLAETIGDRLKSAYEALNDSTLALCRERSTHVKQEAAS
jgi:hypothetical protein